MDEAVIPHAAGQRVPAGATGQAVAPSRRRSVRRRSGRCRSHHQRVAHPSTGGGRWVKTGGRSPRNAARTTKSR